MPAVLTPGGAAVSPVQPPDMRQMVAMLVPVDKRRRLSRGIGEAIELGLDLGPDRIERQSTADAPPRQLAKPRQGSAWRQRASTGQWRKVGQHDMQPDRDAFRQVGQQSLIRTPARHDRHAAGGVDLPVRRELCNRP